MNRSSTYVIVSASFQSFKLSISRKLRLLTALPLIAASRRSIGKPSVSVMLGLMLAYASASTAQTQKAMNAPALDKTEILVTASLEIKNIFSSKVDDIFPLFPLNLEHPAGGFQLLLNELDINPPQTDNPCEYMELKGPGNAIVENLHFVSIEGDIGSNPGVATAVITFGVPGPALGANGLLVVTGSLPCGSRTYGAGTTVIPLTLLDNLGGALQNGTNSFLLISSTTAITPGTDYDTNNDGTLELLPAGAAIVDGVAWTDSEGSDITYGSAVLSASGGTIGAATRFLGVNTANSAAAWYAGALIGTQDSNTYSATVRSANFPPNGALTPGAPNDGVLLEDFFLVTNTNDSGPGSLRQAMINANSNPDISSIRFNIDGSAPHTINSQSALPFIHTTMTIDGTTQPGFNGTPIIELNGVGAGNADGFGIGANNCVIRGFVVNRFNGRGIFISGNNSFVLGNYIGTNVVGTAALGNVSQGIFIVFGTNNIIGGTTTSARNIISGNGTQSSGTGGISIASAGNQVLGNFIGTNAAGTAAVPNFGLGIVVSDPFNDVAFNNVIGGLTPGARNVISGNSFGGIAILGPGSTANQILGNYIGTSVTGATAVANNGPGIVLQSPNSTVGGASVSARNTISGNAGDGITIVGAIATANTIQGNYVGINADGTEAIPNSNQGVDLNNVSGNTVGGNVVSGNLFQGIIIQGTSSNNTVQGNFIGTNAAGTAVVRNNSYGLSIIAPASNNLIGGDTAGARNVISGNNGSGISIESFGTPDGSASGNRVEGNFIGVGADGVTPMGNTAGANPGWGVVISRLARDNNIGGTNPGEGNVIAHNANSGVAVISQDAPAGSTINNRILSNSIFNNGSQGIQLQGSGNNNQAAPSLTSASNPEAGNTTVRGTFFGAANTVYDLQFFTNAVCDPSGAGEGESLDTAATLTTNANGSASFTTVLASRLTLGRVITATATDPAGNTSRFSNCRQVFAETNLSVTTAAAPSTVTLGENVTFSSSVTNQGPNAATNVRLLNTLPANAIFVSASNICTRSVNTITCTIGTLAPGGTAFVDITLRPTFAGILSNSISVALNETDTVPGDNFATATATVNQLLVGPGENLNFETRDFRGWNVVNNCGTGSWNVYSGTASPISSFTIAAPPEGTFAATTDQTGPGTHLLYRDFELDAGRTHALAFNLYYRNRAASFNTPDTLGCQAGPNQQYRVDVLKLDAPVDSVVPSDILATLFRTNVGDPLTLEPTNFSFDLTPFAGSRVRLRFAEVDNMSNFQASVDNVRLTSNCVYSLGSSATTVAAAGGAFSFNVATSPGCPISPVSSVPWITASNAGNSVLYTVAANTTQELRSGTITVNGRVFTVTQSAFICPVTSIGFGLSVNGGFNAGSCSIAGNPADIYSFAGINGQQIVISLDSLGNGGIQPLMQLVAPDGITIIGSDSGSINARIPEAGFFTLPLTGTYTIRVSTLDSAGAYTLSLSQQPANTTCTYTPSPLNTNVSPDGGASFFFDLITEVGCPSVLAATGANSEHISIVSNSGGRITFSVASHNGEANRVGTITAGGRTHTVTQFGVAPPLNDAFASAEMLSGTSGSVPGRNTNASAEQNEPRHFSGAAASRSVWYKWKAPSEGGRYSFTTSGSNFDTVMAIYTGTSVGGLTQIASNDDTTNFDPTSKINFFAVGDATYFIAVDGKNGESGSIQLTYSAFRRLFRLYLQNFNGLPSPITPSSVTTKREDNTGQTIAGALISLGVYEFDLPEDNAFYIVTIDGPSGITWSPATYRINNSSTAFDELMRNLNSPNAGTGQNQVSNATNTIPRKFKGFIHGITTAAELALLRVNMGSSGTNSAVPPINCSNPPFTTPPFLRDGGPGGSMRVQYECETQPNTTHQIIPSAPGRAFVVPLLPLEVLNLDSGPFDSNAITAMNAETYSIRGQISSNGQGLGDVTIDLSSGAMTDRGRSDGSGNYVFSNLASNLSYTLRASRGGFVFQSRTITLQSADAEVNFAAQQCAYSLDPGSLFENDGGSGEFLVTATTSQTCEWTARRGAASEWINIVFGSSIGNGRVRYTVEPHTGGLDRSGTIIVGSQVFTVNQYAPLIQVIQFSNRFDFDADRKADLSVYRPSNKTWYIRRSRDGFMTADFQGAAEDLPVPADYDGDAKTDIAYFRPSNGTWYVFRSTTQTLTTEAWGESGDIPVPADHDGDHRADLVVFRPSNGTWFSKLSLDNSLSATVFGTNGDKPVIGDFDGDGRDDIALFRPADNTWYILKTRDGYATQRWGEEGDIPVPADYNGDGKTDIVIYRPMTGQWHRILSSRGIDVRSWGEPGDIPVAADYDADGRTDIAIYRPSNTTWYVVGTTAGIFLDKFGAAEDRPTPNLFAY